MSFREFLKRFHWKLILRHEETVRISSATGKRETYTFYFWENGWGKRRVKIDCSMEAAEWRGWYATAAWVLVGWKWEQRRVTNEHLIEVLCGGERNPLDG